MTECDTVIFFDLSADECLDGIRARKGKSRPDMPWRDAPEDDDAEFVEFIRNYNRSNRPRVLELLEKYNGKNIIIFNSRNQANELLEALQ